MLTINAQQQQQMLLTFSYILRTLLPGVALGRVVGLVGFLRVEGQGQVIFLPFTTTLF